MSVIFDRRLLLPLFLLLPLLGCGRRSNDFSAVSSADGLPKNLIELPVKLENNTALGLAGHLNLITSYDVKMSGCTSKIESISHSPDQKIKAVLGDTGCTVKLNSLIVYYYYEYTPLRAGSNIYVNANFPGHQLVLQNAPSIGEAVDPSDSFIFSLSEVDNTGNSRIEVPTPPEPTKINTEVEVTSNEAPDFAFSSTFAGYDAELKPKFQFKLRCDARDGSGVNSCGTNKMNSDTEGPGVEYALLPGDADLTPESETLKNATWTPVTNYAESFFTADMIAPAPFILGQPLSMIFIMRNPARSISFYRLTVNAAAD